jgi:hypothetical protein
VGGNIQQLFEQAGINILVFIMAHGTPAFDQSFQMQMAGQIALQRG